MEITTLGNLINEGLAKPVINGIEVQVAPSMIIVGEDRLSYTTLFRLVECCREYHWKKDLLPLITHQSDLDSICRCLTANFKRAIFVGKKILITYSVTEMHIKSYHLHFLISDEQNEREYATIEMVCVFYDPLIQKAIIPPVEICEYLTKISENHKIY